MSIKYFVVLFASLLFFSCVISDKTPIGLGTSKQKLLSVNFPFPQHVTYIAGTIKPNNVTQTQMDTDVAAYYDTWKAAVVMDAGMSSRSRQMYRIKFSDAEPTVTVSEMQGYGMIIVAIMAGHDASAETIYNGLFEFFHEYPSDIDGRLMGYRIPYTGETNSAFDGDAAVAYSLLLANKQWGSAGDVDYATEATTLITAIKASTIGPQSRLPMLGDWTDPTGGTYNQYTPRTSDFMLAYFKAFRRFTNDATWDAVINASDAVVGGIQSDYSASTGLQPDFVINANTIAQPAPAGFLEGSHDGHHYYNAGRDPWNLGNYALLNSDAAVKNQLIKIAQWNYTKCGGTVANIKAGWNLAGTTIGNYWTSFFVAPFAVATMFDSSKQAFLNSMYAALYNYYEGPFEDSINLQALITISGNFWDPTTIDNPITPPAQDTLYFTITKSGTAGGVAYNKEDVIKYDKGAGVWSIYFDGSDVGLSGINISGIQFLSDTSMLFSVGANVILSGAGACVSSDVIRFIPTSYGADTAGTFEKYQSGAAIGLSQKPIDGLVVVQPN
jgi:endoglucanase